MKHLSVMYLEDQDSHEYLFSNLMTVAGKARGIEVDVKTIHGLDEVPPGPLYDVILIDLVLEHSDRYETFAWIAAHHEHMPTIVVLSGHEDCDEESLLRGAHDFVAKADVVRAPEAFIQRLKLDVIRHRIHKRQFA